MYAHNETHACVQVLQALQYQYADAAVQAAGGPAVHPHSRAGSDLDNMPGSALGHPLPYGQVVQNQEDRNDGRKGQAMSLAMHPSAGMAMGAAAAAFVPTSGMLSAGGGGARSVGMLGGGSSIRPCTRPPDIKKLGRLACRDCRDCKVLNSAGCTVQAFAASTSRCTH